MEHNPNFGIRGSSHPLLHKCIIYYHTQEEHTE